MNPMIAGLVALVCSSTAVLVGVVSLTLIRSPQLRLTSARAGSPATRSLIELNRHLPVRILLSSALTHESSPNSVELLSRTLEVLFSRALGGAPVALVPVGLEHADVIVVSQYGPTEELSASIAALARARRNQSILMFFALENTDSWGGEDGFVDFVDVSFGQARWNRTRDAARALSAANFMRFPAWIPSVLNPVGRAPPACDVLPALLKPADPREWFARPRFAALLARHGGFPREDLCSYFDGIAAELAAAEAASANSSAPPRRQWRLDRPGAFQNNLRMPPGDDKAALLRLYRYNLAPENTRSARTGGYATEKLPEAHAAGTVPVYYGDAVLDAQFWNPARVLTLDDGEAEGSGGVSPAELIAHVMRLETDADARAAFFREPVLAPTAQRWLDDWFDTGAGLVRAAIAAHPVLQARFLGRAELAAAG